MNEEQLREKCKEWLIVRGIVWQGGNLDCLVAFVKNTIQESQVHDSHCKCDSCEDERWGSFVHQQKTNSPKI